MAKEWQVYLVKCADGTLYCGITKNIGSRIERHNAGRGAKYTAARRPVTLLDVSGRMELKTAMKEERYIKRLRRNEKLHYLQLLK